tara:strand:- start:328 stop:540 length:213 start_codon:yes stop_codon:yes gene_type:complete
MLCPNVVAYGDLFVAFILAFVDALLCNGIYPLSFRMCIYLATIGGQHLTLLLESFQSNLCRPLKIRLVAG